MRFKQTQGRSFLNAKNFTIAMVVVNAAGFVAVQQKMKQAEIPDAYALDDGALPVLARSDVVLPERPALPEVALAAPAPLPADSLPPLPAIKPLPIIDLASLELAPVAAPEEVATARSQRGIAMAVEKPVSARRVAKRVDIAVPVARPATADSFSRAFDSVEAPAEVGLTTPADAIGVTVGPEAAPPVASDVAVPSAAPVESELPASDLGVPRLDPSAGQHFPAAPVEEEPAELPAAA